jgi:hypothetical protein
MRARQRFALAVLLASTVSAFAIGPATKANDDSCDIALVPAATLLLPYFEVDFSNVSNQNTLFSVTNVTNTAQIARVTLWTDFSYPVMSFNLYLTGYDVQSISLYDVIANGLIGSGTGTATSHQGAYSDPNAQLDMSSCAQLPGSIPASFITRMQAAFAVGETEACHDIGHPHEYAVGYATIDVVGNCSSAMPTDPEYFANDIRYDNVLAGDYQQISGRLHYAEVSPMVHIRAIPEGGTPDTRAASPATYANRFSHTFYERFQSASRRTGDARQPLPSRFATRWISGGPGEFQTQFKIWRQSKTGSNIDCATLHHNGRLHVTDDVMFDEDENGEGFVAFTCVGICIGDPFIVLPSTSLAHIQNTDVFPQSVRDHSTAGWLYFNLDDNDVTNGAHQSWVVTSMRAAEQFAGNMEALALGNGCSHPVGAAEESEAGSVVIAPSPNGEPEP